MSETRKPSFGVSMLPILLLIVLLGLNVYLFGDNATGGPNQIALLLSGMLAAIIGLFHHFNWEKLQDGIVRSIKTSLPAVLILLIIGALAGTWLISGVVPAMIYYGLDVLSPSVFLPAACIVSAVISIATGSSWTTTATIGVALMGIGGSLGFGPGVTAGAVISGAYFGDKMSPLSDTTNLAPAMAGTDLFTHIRYMAITTIPSFLIALIIFVFIGLGHDKAISMDGVSEMQNLISNKFNITPWLFLVPAVVIVLIVKKVDAVPALLIGSLAGALFAIIFQPQIVKSVSGYTPEVGESFIYLKHSYMALINSMSSDVAIETGNPEVNDLLSSGGMAGMLNTIWLILCAMIFGGLMEITGMLKVISDTMMKFVNSAASLIATTVGTCLFFNATTSDQYLAIVVPGRMYADTYREKGLKPENLSRTLEDSGTVTSVLFSWNTCGAYQSTVLGVMTGEYLMYCFFNLISPIMTLIVAYSNFRIKRYTEEEMVELAKVDPIDM